MYDDGMGTKHVAPRMQVLLAREARVGVIVRRGPSPWVRLIRWDRDGDRFEGGQWLRAHVYVRRSDLSPDGGLLIYFATDYGRQPPAWTAICRAPYFVSTVVWPQEDAWGGGGLFVENRKYRLNEHSGEDYPIFERRLVRDGWLVQGDWVKPDAESGYRVWEKSGPGGLGGWVLVMKGWGTSRSPRAEGLGSFYEEYSLRRAGGGEEMALAGVEWADWDGERLVFAREGQIWELRDPARGVEGARSLYDARGEEPAEVAVPEWAMEVGEIEGV